MESTDDKKLFFERFRKFTKESLISQLYEKEVEIRRLRDRVEKGIACLSKASSLCTEDGEGGSTITTGNENAGRMSRMTFGERSSAQHCLTSGQNRDQSRLMGGVPDGTLNGDSLAELNTDERRTRSKRQQKKNNVRSPDIIQQAWKQTVPSLRRSRSRSIKTRLPPSNVTESDYDVDHDYAICNDNARDVKFAMSEDGVREEAEEEAREDGEEDEKGEGHDDAGWVLTVTVNPSDVKEVDLSVDEKPPLEKPPLEKPATLEDKMWKCPQCRLTFESYNLRRCHLKKVHYGKTVRKSPATVESGGSLCTLCGLRFTSDTEKRRHRRNEHKEVAKKPRTKTTSVKVEDGRTWTCTQCPLVFPTYNQRKRHQVKIHYGKTVRGPPKTVEMGGILCTFCDLQFDNVLEKRRHCRQEHKGMKKFVRPRHVEDGIECRHCSLIFASKKELKYHCRKMHYVLDKTLRICPTCGLSVTPDRWTKHLRKHENLRYVCQHCCKIFTEDSSLSRHKRRWCKVLKLERGEPVAKSSSSRYARTYVSNVKNEVSALALSNDVNTVAIGSNVTVETTYM